MKGYLGKKIWWSFIGIFLLMLIFFPFLAKAEKGIKLLVSPEMFELEVKRGEEFFEKIKIHNKSEVPVPIEVSITNFGAQEETGTITFFEEPILREGEEDISYNPRKWIEIENPNFILDPSETEEVRLKINIPENAEPGGKYAVVLFKPRLSSYYFKEGQPRAIPVIGVLFLFSVEVEGLERLEGPLTVVEFNIPENLHLKRLENFVANIAGLFTEVRAAEEEMFSIVETSHLPFTLRIKNNDIFHIKPEGKLLISTNNGKIVGETKIQKTTILPGKIRKFPVEFKPNLPEKFERYLPAAISNFISKNLLFGKYQAHLFLTIENDIIEKNIEFWAFPWKTTLSTVFISLLLLFVLIKYRKRIKSAVKVLVRK
ncbi:hypothetical protein KJA16_02615 [Patescibacteria group bacterium]|nr:hypothetical protein [Patescibacteria group bacterium]